MSIDNRFRIWRRASDGITLMRQMGSARGAGWWTQFRPWNGIEYFDIPLTYGQFVIEADGSFTCPCGSVFRPDDAGHLLRLIDHHCATSGHPKPVLEP